MGLMQKLKNKIANDKAKKQALKEKADYHKQVLKDEKNRAKEERIAPEGSFISLVNVNKIYPNHVQAVYDFNIDIKEKEFIVFVGPSGCGKSTTLRMIAGLEDITSGDLFINGEYCNDLTPKERNIAMVFQSYALYPHMSVYENMAFGLKINHYPKQEIKERVMHAAEILGLVEYLDRKPGQLSGGQCQRVALGRAIVRNSKLFLMDEPLSNLDAKLRVSMRSEIVKLHNRLGATTVYVTHDQTEAMTMATRIVVMNKGYIQQIGTPQEIYQNPANLFVATFIGAPAMNVLTAIVNKDAIRLQNGVEIKTSANYKELLSNFYEQEGRAELINLESYEVKLGVRPESISVSKESGELKINVIVSELLGSEYFLHFDLNNGEELVAKTASDNYYGSGDEVYLNFDTNRLHIFDPLSGKTIK